MQATENLPREHVENYKFYPHDCLENVEETVKNDS